MNPASPTPNSAQMPVDRDVLISRAVEGRAHAADWLALRDLATSDQAVWADLSTSQAQATLLREALECELAGAGMTPLPRPGLQLVSAEGERPGAPVSLSLHTRVRRAIPWALAAALGLAFVSQFANRAGPSGVPAAGPQTAGPSVVPATYATADDALRAYLDLGREQGSVVAELPQRYVVESRPAASGVGYEVLYLRQVLERAVVNDLYRTGEDDTGRRVLLPASMPAAGDGPL